MSKMEKFLKANRRRQDVYSVGRKVKAYFENIPFIDRRLGRLDLKLDHKPWLLRRIQAILYIWRLLI